MKHYHEKVFEKPIDVRCEAKKLQELFFDSQRWFPAARVWDTFAAFLDQANFQNLPIAANHLSCKEMLSPLFAATINGGSLEDLVTLFECCHTLICQHASMFPGYYRDDDAPKSFALDVSRIIRFNVEAMNCKITAKDVRGLGRVSIIVKVDDYSSAVFQTIRAPKVRDLISEYNQYSNVEDSDIKKRIIRELYSIAEPFLKRDHSKEGYNRFCSVTCGLVNNCNLNHNNIDKESKHNLAFADFSENERAEAYDLIFRRLLLALVLRESDADECLVQNLRKRLGIIKS